VNEQRYYCIQLILRTKANLWDWNVHQKCFQFRSVRTDGLSNNSIDVLFLAAPKHSMPEISKEHLFQKANLNRPRKVLAIIGFEGSLRCQLSEQSKRYLSIEGVAILERKLLQRETGRLMAIGISSVGQSIEA
jgi:hypothetical protein